MNHQDNRRRLLFRRPVIGFVGLAFVLLIAWAIVSRTRQHQTASLPQVGPDQMVQTVGIYKFPNGTRTLEVTEDNNGNVCITVRIQASTSLLIPLTKLTFRTGSADFIEHQIVFESERDWFAAVDSFDRLWIYYGRWNKQWGDLRKLPGGGTRPYQAAVIMHGLSFLDSQSVVQGSQVVTDTGHWDGVPAQFLEQVRSAMLSETNSDLQIPSHPPAFTSEQQALLLRRLSISN
ncbi:MAG: hypothetical protein JNL58_30555 [Planctomyces sp.]|nr:hypothetical protein [Planctomyces sp.]